MTDETTLAAREYPLAWDTDVVRLTVAADVGGIAVQPYCSSCGYSTGDEDPIAVSWPDVLKHAPTAALRDEILRREDAML